jgi:hypothetical protein
MTIKLLLISILLLTVIILLLGLKFFNKKKTSLCSINHEELLMVLIVRCVVLSTRKIAWKKKFSLPFLSNGSFTKLFLICFHKHVGN